MNTSDTRSIALLIKSHMMLLGHHAALSRAKKISGITIADSGDILRITRDPDLVREELERSYASFAGVASRIIARSLRTAIPEHER